MLRSRANRKKELDPSFRWGDDDGSLVTTTVLCGDDSLAGTDDSAAGGDGLSEIPILQPVVSVRYRRNSGPRSSFQRRPEFRSIQLATTARLSSESWNPALAPRRVCARRGRLICKLQRPNCRRERAHDRNENDRHGPGCSRTRALCRRGGERSASVTAKPREARRAAESVIGSKAAGTQDSVAANILRSCAASHHAISIDSGLNADSGARLESAESRQTTYCAGERALCSHARSTSFWNSRCWRGRCGRYSGCHCTPMT